MLSFFLLIFIDLASRRQASVCTLYSVMHLTVSSKFLVKINSDKGCLKQVWKWVGVFSIHSTPHPNPP